MHSMPRSSGMSWHETWRTRIAVVSVHPVYLSTGRGTANVCKVVVWGTSAAAAEVFSRDDGEPWPKDREGQILGESELLPGMSHVLSGLKGGTIRFGCLPLAST